MRARRQALLRNLVADGRVRSQADAVTLLADAGITATQATVSRDLEALGTVRVRTAGGVRYALSDTPAAFGAPLQVVLRQYVVSGTASGPLAVLRTPPGHANVVAAALDRAQLAGILGTVAGDDTLFVCGDDRIGGSGVLALLDAVSSTPAAAPYPSADGHAAPSRRSTRSRANNKEKTSR